MSFALSSFPAEDPRFRGILQRRAGAFLIDAVMLGLFGWAAVISIFLFGLITLGAGFLLFHLIPLLPIVYGTLLIPNGGTLGQRLFGLRLAAETGPAAPTYAEAFVWSLLLGISVFFGFIPCLLALTNPSRRAAHDLLSGLTVFKAD